MNLLKEKINTLEQKLKITEIGEEKNRNLFANINKHLDEILELNPASINVICLSIDDKIDMLAKKKEGV